MPVQQVRSIPLRGHGFPPKRPRKRGRRSLRSRQGEDRLLHRRPADVFGSVYHGWGSQRFLFQEKKPGSEKPVPDPLPGILPQISGYVAETNKFAFVDLPSWLEEAHVKALLEPFGELKSCMLLTNPKSEKSLGVLIFEFRESGLNQAVCDALNGLMMGDHPFSVRSVTDINEDDPELLQHISTYNLAQSAASGDPTSVLVLSNMFTEDDLKEEYEEILNDISEEARQHGTVVKVIIPRPSDNPEELIPGIGKAFIQFESDEEAKKALESMNGRTFADRAVVAFYYPLSRFDVGLYY